MRLLLGAIGGVTALSLAIGLGGCLPEDEYPVSTPDASSSSGNTTQTSSSSSGVPSSSGTTSGSTSSGDTSTSSSSSSGAAPPPPPPQKILDGCFRDGAVLPAGAAPSELPGDCFHDGCDGMSRDAIRTFDARDFEKDDPNPCVQHSCSTTGPVTGVAEHGKGCGTEGGVCFKGKCTVCKPTNTTSCAAEGGNEPANDAAATATGYAENSTVCGFSSGSDTDWYTFYAEDSSFVTDVFDFDVWTTAPNLEVCIYVACGGGTPSGCPGIKAGPNGSHGCCWSGIPGSVHPRWDMDCSGTSEDSGTAYVSVRTPGGDTCEPYLIAGHY